VGRVEFSKTELVISATLDTGMDPVPTEVMNRSETEDRQILDSEGGDGVEDYKPLWFQSHFKFPTYYRNVSQGWQTTQAPQRINPADQALWDFLPISTNAPSVVFRILIREKTSGLELASVQTERLPLAYDEVVQPMTPSPKSKCHRQQYGILRDGHCHRAVRLDSVCLQIEKQFDGSWKMHYHDTATNPTEKVAFVTRHGFTGPVSAVQDFKASYGCDPRSSWLPGTYAVDKCWANVPKSHCEDNDMRHNVQVVVRSSEDPFLKAQELTNSRLDFGLSAASQQVYGISMLVIGSLVGCPVIVYIRFLLQKKPSDIGMARQLNDFRDAGEFGSYNNLSELEG